MIRKEPCIACPYKRDVPSGVWAASEYGKLVEYDNPTGEQPFGAFACHATPEHLCHGWAVVHNNRGHDHELLALRLFAPDEAVPPAHGDLFASGTEAAEHGMKDIAKPTKAAHDAIHKLINKHSRLQ